MSGQGIISYEDWKNLSVLQSKVVKHFANAFDIVFQKDEKELKSLFYNHLINQELIEKRVRRLNALYHTHLRNTDIVDICNYLTKKGTNLENSILSGDIDVVEQIAHSCGKNRFVFATKYCSFLNPDAYPIYDSLITKTLKFFNDKNAFINGNLRFETIRVNCEYNSFKEIVDLFRAEFCPECTYKQIDQFLWLVGKNMPE